MKQKLLQKTLLLLFALIAGSTSVWADEGDVHDMSITQQTGLNNNASIPSIGISNPGYSIKQVQVGWKYNKDVNDIVTIAVSIGETSLGTQTVGGKTTAVATFDAADLTGDIVISFTNHAGSGTGKGTFYVQSVKLVEGAAAGLTYWTATYDYNDGVTANKVVNVNKGDAAAAYTLEAAPSRANFNFLGWDDGTNTYDGGAAYPLTSNKTFTAQWEYSGPCTIYNKSTKSDIATGAQYILVGKKSGENQFAVDDIGSGHLYFSSSAVTNANSSITDTKATIVDETPLVLTLEESEDGWYLRNSSDASLGLSGEKQLKWDDGDMTWELDGYDDTPTFTAEYNSTDYVLYYNSSANRFNAYTSKGSNVYAYFYRLDDGKDVYTLTLNFNDGETADGEHRVLEDATYNLPTPTRDGCTFAGWNTAIDGSGTSYVGGYPYPMPAEATTLYAIWTIEIAPTKDYTTYVTTKAMDFTGVSGLKAFVATAAAASGVTLTEPTAAVPAGTPLVLKKVSGSSFDVPVVASATAPVTNLLVAGDGTTPVGGDGVWDYILSGGLFYHVSPAGPVAVGKAYLHLDSAPGARELTINFDDETAINALENSNKVNDGAIYDLSGRRVENPTKGIYIMNGKKVVIK